MTSRPGFFGTLKVNYAGTLVDPGRSIRRARTNAQMTQAELAKKAGISAGYLSALELNRHPASDKIYSSIARALGMTEDQMFGV